jgi:hypothetical protein
VKSSGHRRTLTPLCWKLAAVFALLVVCLPACARSYRIANFNSTVHVDSDGSARVEEQITFVFSGAYQGIYRDIPTDYPGPAGSNYTLFIKLGAITDDQGNKLKYEKSTSGGYLKLKIYVPGAVDATRTVNIEYSIDNATRFFDDHDEFSVGRGGQAAGAGF